MFVVMALVTTFATTPLTAALYPPWYQTKIEAWKRGEIDWDTGKPTTEDASTTRDSITYEKMEAHKIHKMLVYLRLDNMAPILSFMALLGGNTQVSSARLHPQHESQRLRVESDTGLPPVRPIEAHGVRLLELTERESSVMQVSEIDEYTIIDPLVSTFRTVAAMHNLAVSGEVSILPESRFPDALSEKAQAMDSDFMLLPWSETGSMSESQTISSDGQQRKMASPSYIAFMTSVLHHSPCNTAIFINKNFGGPSQRSQGRPGMFRTKSLQSLSSEKRDGIAAPIRDRSHHIFCPFFGGADDRYALRIVLQMAENPEVTATIVHFEVGEAYFNDEVATPSSPVTPSRSQDKLSTTVTHAQPAPSDRDATFFLSLKNSIPVDLAARVFFETVSAPTTPIQTMLARVGKEVGQNPHNAGDLVVVGRNAARNVSFSQELGKDGAEARKCLGALGDEVVKSSLRTSVLVLQAHSHANL